MVRAFTFWVTGVFLKVTCGLGLAKALESQKLISLFLNRFMFEKKIDRVACHGTLYLFIRILNNDFYDITQLQIVCPSHSIIMEISPSL